MPTTTSVPIDEARLVQAIEEAAAKLDSGETEVSFDFSSVRRVDAAALGALEKLAAASQSKGATVVLRGVNIEVYKVLKLLKIAPRFSFAT